MSRKNKEEYNEYMRGYMLRRYHERREWAFRELGGRCANCGSAEGLQLHHTDSDKKKFSVGGRLWNQKQELFEEEVYKCELLCSSCHVDTHRVTKHGTLSMYKYCRCNACKEAHNAYCREWKRKKRGV